MTTNVADASQEIVIEPRSGWRLVDLSELNHYRDLLWNLTWRNIKGRYAQSALGVGWVLVQPLITLLIFVVVFGRVVKVPVPGATPFPIFAFCGLVPWLAFSGALTSAAASVHNEVELLTKVYFPRLILPLSNVLGRLFDLAATLLTLLALMAWYGVAPRPEAVVMIPLLSLLLSAVALGAGLWLAAMAVQYRDVAVAIGFLAQIWMYLSPVFYPIELVPERFRLIYGLNPMAGVITGFRSSLLGEPQMPWGLLAEGAAVGLALLLSGALYFRRSERLFADVV